MDNQWWSWILTVVGVTGFFLAGRKVWWSWYINLGCQALWFIYAFVTEQYGFIFAAAVYTVVFTKNAVSWTKERFVNDKHESVDCAKIEVRQRSVKVHPSHTMTETMRGGRIVYCKVCLADTTRNPFELYLRHRRCVDKRVRVITEQKTP